MSWSKKVHEAPKGLQEPDKYRDDGIEHLWTKLNPGRDGALDLKGLQRGFRKIDHRES
jgi:solute carrier family 25 phosphate transporter 23/24/25/41